MSFEAYSVAVKLSLINNVSSGLLLISKNMKTVHDDAEKLNQKLKSIGKDITVGGMMFGGGMMMAGMFKGPIDEAIKYQKEIAKLQQMGLGDSQIAEAQKFVKANEIIGTSLQDRIQLFTEAQGSFRQSGMSGSKALEAAKVMMPSLAYYQVASSMLSDDKQGVAHNQFMQLNKTVELMGGLNSPIRAQQIVDGVFKAVQSSGRMVSNRDLRLFITQAGPAAVALSDKTIFAGLEPIIGEFGGDRVGTGLSTAYSRTHGMMALAPSILTNEALRLGLWDKHKVERSKGGGARFKHGSPMTPVLGKLMETDTIAFAQEMMKIYKKNGINQLTDMARENAILFGTTGGRIYTKIMQQMPVLLESEHAFDKAKGTKETVENNKNSPMMAFQKFDKAMKDLKLAIGTNILPVLTPMINELADLSKELGRHPSLIRGVTYAFAGLSAALALGGLALMIRGTAGAFILLGGTLISLPAKLLAARLGLASMSTSVIGAATSFGLLQKAASAFMVFAAAYAGYQAGTWLNNHVVNPGVQKLTGDKNATLGTWIYDKFHPNDGKNAVAPVATRHSQPVQVHTQIDIDGKKIASAVTMHQTNAASKLPASTGVNPYLGMPFPSSF
ncbi:hypothetical protein E0H86_07120 [Acinetobacter sp. ANC 4635]|uniref:hypothetical protein n=1 Tax=Acinetobacter sp. ANC 4635 TaxID=2529846 RepID=UPI00103A3CBB|nr:hypothetical protein [Acinetobacter sp. ANC 4635]TCB32179.1 hypothetical protein E0H86_07120 [Acinetobacter sp. ANC 4635]